MLLLITDLLLTPFVKFPALCTLFDLNVPEFITTQSALVALHVTSAIKFPMHVQHRYIILHVCIDTYLSWTLLF